MAGRKRAPEQNGRRAKVREPLPLSAAQFRQICLLQEGSFYKEPLKKISGHAKKVLQSVAGCDTVNRNGNDKHFRSILARMCHKEIAF
ncbi:MAG: hypothetical protein LBQ15_03115 [Clostridium sp.]|nr:hypothetical protein [Clostridium sp.]